MQKLLLSLISILFCANAVAFNRAPLVDKPYEQLPLGDVRAEGWLLEQLMRMRSGMSGTLDQIMPNVVGPRNCWLGGDGDAWERGPYWIDGLLPLAYILDDDSLKERVAPWIEWTLASQGEDGYFGPSVDRGKEPGLQRDKARDWWPKMVMLKALQQHYSATGDKRVIPFMTAYFRYQLAQLPKTPLNHWTHWGGERGGDNLAVIYWLYNITGEEFLLELADLVYSQTYDWYAAFSLQNDVLYRQHSVHCVNLGQGFKTPAIRYQQSGDKALLGSLHTAKRTISKTFGFPTGLWAGDELTRFGNPVYGSELCTAVEMMYSLGEIIKISGDVSWADYLERVAYNALPTQITDDCTLRQYYQQLNQIEISRTWRDFTTPHADTDQLFGQMTGYACCTANLHQAWPKFVQNLWYATADGGLAALVYAPSRVTTALPSGREVTIVESTEYPFRESVEFLLSFSGKRGESFPLHLRLPSWSDGYTLTVNNEPVEVENVDNILKISRTWKSGDRVAIHFNAKVRSSRWFDGGVAVERGPLLYALKMNERWERHEVAEDEKVEYGEHYYEVFSDTPWNYCILKQDLRNLDSKSVVTHSDNVATYPWSVDGAPLSITIPAHRLPRWQQYCGSVGHVNYYINTKDRRDVDMEESTIELIPYGCTTLRVALFPVR